LHSQKHKKGKQIPEKYNPHFFILPVSNWAGAEH
jgi:hypothetical protein